jgi:DNA-binding transcriptional ArsR family regulator
MAAALAVIDRPEQAAALLKPEHRRLLELLSTPDSAAGLARRLNTSRQIVAYHLKELEEAGLIAVATERKKGNCIERIMKRTARSWVIGPQALGALGSDPETMPDKLASSYLVAIAARTIKEISVINRAAAEQGKTVATLTLDTEIRFRSAQERKAFTEEFTAALASLVTKYHDEKSPGGRRFRLFAGAHPYVKHTPA